MCQPNDVGPFKPLKNEWKAAVASWRHEHPYKVLNKASFASVLKVAMSKLNPQAIVSGYRSTGLYPFNEEAVHYERITATNRRKFDSRAFSKAEDNRPTEPNPEFCPQMALKLVENILGAEVVGTYRQAHDFSLEILNDIGAFGIWKQLMALASGEVSSSCAIGLLEKPVSMQTNLNEPIVASSADERISLSTSEISANRPNVAKMMLAVDLRRSMNSETAQCSNPLLMTTDEESQIMQSVTMSYQEQTNLELGVTKPFEIGYTASSQCNFR